MKKKLVTVVEARYESGYRLRLRFSGESERTVDFSQWLHGPVFAPLITMTGISVAASTAAAGDWIVVGENL